MPSINDDIIDHEIALEGPPTNDPQDVGGRTQFGISERSNPQAWADGKVTEEEARAIYETKYLTHPGFHHILDVPLRRQLVDFGVTSGPQLAIMKLQTLLHVEADGILGPITLTALANVHPETINTQLVVARLIMICRLVQKVPADLKYLTGWVTRAAEFLL